jgi:hypothetical protein
VSRRRCVPLASRFRRPSDCFSSRAWAMT